MIVVNVPRCNFERAVDGGEDRSAHQQEGNNQRLLVPPHPHIYWSNSIFDMGTITHRSIFLPFYHFIARIIYKLSTLSLCAHPIMYYLYPTYRVYFFYIFCYYCVLYIIQYHRLIVLLFIIPWYFILYTVLYNCVTESYTQTVYTERESIPRV